MAMYGIATSRKAKPKAAAAPKLVPKWKGAPKKSTSDKLYGAKP